MSFRDNLQKALTPEMFEQVTDALGDDFDFDLVPRTRLNKVIKQRNEARAALNGTQPPKTHGKPTAGSKDDDDDDDVPLDIEALKSQFQQDADERVRGVQIQYAALEQLRNAHVIDPELIWSSSALDKSKLSLDASGKLVGLDDMLTELKKNKAHLFKEDKPPVPKGTGKDGGSDFDSITTRDAFLKLPVDKQIAFKEANPTIFKQFMSTM